MTTIHTSHVSTALSHLAKGATSARSAAVSLARAANEDQSADSIDALTAALAETNEETGNTVASEVISRNSVKAKVQVGVRFLNLARATGVAVGRMGNGPTVKNVKNVPAKAFGDTHISETLPMLTALAESASPAEADVIVDEIRKALGGNAVGEGTPKPRKPRGNVDQVEHDQEDGTGDDTPDSTVILAATKGGKAAQAASIVSDLSKRQLLSFVDKLDARTLANLTEAILMVNDRGEESAAQADARDAAAASA